ncbi:MAG: hypothetical protein AB1411_15720 [Nitrospirota bacterium]
MGRMLVDVPIADCLAHRLTITAIVGGYAGECSCGRWRTICLLGDAIAKSRIAREYARHAQGRPRKNRRRR